MAPLVNRFQGWSVSELSDELNNKIPGLNEAVEHLLKLSALIEKTGYPYDDDHFACVIQREQLLKVAEVLTQYWHLCRIGENLQQYGTKDGEAEEIKLSTSAIKNWVLRIWERNREDAPGAKRKVPLSVQAKKMPLSGETDKHGIRQVIAKQAHKQC